MHRCAWLSENFPGWLWEVSSLVAHQAHSWASRVQPGFQALLAPSPPAGFCREKGVHWRGEVGDQLLPGRDLHPAFPCGDGGSWAVPSQCPWVLPSEGWVVLVSGPTLQASDLA